MKQDELYFGAVAGITANYFTKLGVNAELFEDDGSDASLLYDITAFIQVNGAVQGGLVLTVEERLGRALAKKFIIEDINEEEAAQYAVEVLAEIFNVVSANALADHEERDILLGNPLIIVTPGAEIRSKSSYMFKKAIRTASGTGTLLFIPSDRKAELASIFASRTITDLEAGSSG